MSEVQKVFLYRFLPTEVREFFLERGWEDLEVIQQRYGLAPQSVDVLDQIQQEILFGYEPIDKVENLIRTRLKYDEVLTRRVAMDFIEMRFLPLDSYLQSAPFRLYAALGGNTTVLRIASVPSGGLTAARVRTIQEAFLEELRQENAKRMKQGDEREGDGSWETGDGGAKDDGGNGTEEVRMEEGENEREDGTKDTNMDGIVENVGTLANSEDVEDEQANDIANDDEVSESVEAVNNDNVDGVIHNAEVSDQNDEPVTTVVSETSDDVSGTTVVQDMSNDHGADTEDAALHTPEEHAKMVPIVEPEAEMMVLPPQEVSVTESPKTEDEVQQVKTVAKMDAALDAKEPQSNPVNTEQKPKTALDALVARDAAEADVLTALKQGSKTVGVAEHPGVQKVRDACELPVLAPELEKRLRVLIGSRLSGVRKQEVLLSALTKSVDQGGMGFESAMAMRIGSLVADEVMGIHKASLEKTQTEKKAFVEARQAVWQPSLTDKSLQDAISNPAGSIVASQDSPSHEYIGPLSSPSVNKAGNLVTPASSSSPKSPLSSPAPRIVSVKVPMTDIQAPPRKLTGPVEELGTMTLVNFRRMPGGLDGAIRTIEEQMAHMSVSDPAMSLRAMSAWMQSPLVLEYRRLLSVALQAGIPLERILRDPTQNPQGFLPEEMQGLRHFHAKMRAHSA